MDFITSASNLRATNYNIENVSKHKTKGIAGNIIPAISTTTSIVAGLVTLELYKLIQNFNSVEKFNDSFINLALPYFGYSDPVKCVENKVNDFKFNLWTKIIVKNIPTLEGLIEHLESIVNCDVDMITYGDLMLFSFITNPVKLMSLKKMNVIDIIQSKTDKILKKIYYT